MSAPALLWRHDAEEVGYHVELVVRNLCTLLDAEIEADLTPEHEAFFKGVRLLLDELDRIADLAQHPKPAESPESAL